MLVISVAGTPAAVFFDSTGRRRRAFRAALIILLCAVAVLVALVVVGATSMKISGQPAVLTAGAASGQRPLIADGYQWSES